MNATAGNSWFEAVVERFERPLLAYAYRLGGGDWQAAQDAVQETFLRLCRADRAAVEARLAPWLFAVCRSRVIDMQRTPQPTPVAWESEHPMDHRTDPTAAVCAAEETAATQSRLEQCLRQLSPRQQEVLRLRVAGELSYRDIAEVTGMTVNNVGFHLHQAIARLRQLMVTSAE